MHQWRGDSWRREKPVDIAEGKSLGQYLAAARQVNHGEGVIARLVNLDQVRKKTFECRYPSGVAAMAYFLLPGVLKKTMDQ